MSLMSLTAVELAKKIKAGETTAVEAAKDALAQIKEKEKSIHSYVTVLDEAQILEKAGEVQKKIQAGELTGPLAGVPVAIKDNMCTEGILTTCSSKILGNFVPTYSSEAVKKLEEAGVVLIGKTNMDEFAMGTLTIQTMSREDLPVVPVPQWPLKNVLLPWVPIPVVPSASQVLSVALPASSRLTELYLVTV